MYKLFTLLFAVFALLAGRVFATGEFNITLNPGPDGNVTARDFLAISDNSLLTACANDCSTAITTLAACNIDDQSCFCANTTWPEVNKCEQCFFTQLIKENKPMPGGDTRAGGQTALAAYATACNLSTDDTKTLTTLNLPTDWNGPFGQGLETATTAITLIAALAVGVGAIGVLVTM